MEFCHKTFSHVYLDILIPYFMWSDILQNVTKFKSQEYLHHKIRIRTQ